MSNYSLNAQAVQENAHSLAAALGIDTEHAEELLAVHALVTVDESESSSVFLGEQVSKLLARTLQSAGTQVDPVDTTVEVVIGQAVPRSAAPTIWVTLDSNAAYVSRQRPKLPGVRQVHPALLIIVACYGAAAALRLIIGDGLPLPNRDPLVLDLQALGVTPALLSRQIDVGHIYLAGAGAIGNGYLWTLRWFDVRGQLDIVDFDVVKAGNLNRQLWFLESDVTLPKAERLAARAQPSFPDLRLVPRVARLQDLPEKTADPRWLRRLVVGVDSRLARRSLQSEIPGEVFDASTTDIREIVLHFNRQPTSQACLGCIYPPDELEAGRTRDIARALGVTIDDVQGGVITPAAANVILARYPDRGLTAATLEGEAYDSLFKALCAKAALRTEADRQVFAPFAFVSALAGALLAIETVRRVGGDATCFNLWKISPWLPFIPKLQREISAIPTCSVCGESVFRDVARQLWGA
jgi:molybdopterin/thiamine biosynthesis adenylyltransferase